MRGKSRAEYRAHTNTKYNSDANADRIRRLAVNNNVNTIFEAVDNDQIALALMHTLRRPKVKPYMNRVIASFNNERARVGINAVDGMETLVTLIANG